MFDLEKAIAAWRRSFRYRRAFFEDDLEELERHLRDHLAGLVAQGWAEKEAFGEAVRGVGDYGAMEAEYRKVFWAKVKHKRGVLREIIWEMTMVKNYVKVAFRTLRKHKGYALINVTGLAVGLACCLLILLYVMDELSYDRHHEHAERIYRVASRRQAPNSDRRSARTPPPMAAALVNDFPEIVQATRLWKRAEPVLVSYEDKLFEEDGVLTADPSIFDLFDIPLLQGDPQTFADTWHSTWDSIIITEATAKKYFGDEDPIGKILYMYNSRNYVVRGVAANPTHHSHLNFDILTSLPLIPAGRSTEWLGPEVFNVYTYILLQENAAPEALEAKFPQMAQHYVADVAEGGTTHSFFLQPLTDIHLHSHLETELAPNGEAAYVYIFSAIALFILLIACVNFMNLATARSAGRAREIGVRKVLGSQRGPLIRQFLLESMLLSVLALMLALALVMLLLPAFNDLASKDLVLGVIGRGTVLAGVLGTTVLVGLLAGLYPALYLSAFRPMAVLKGTLGPAMKQAAFRNGLVVFQFAVSMALIAGTVVVHSQNTYMLTKKLGFDKEHVLVVERINWGLDDRAETFKQEVLQHPDVISSAFAGNLPGSGAASSAARFSGRVQVAVEGAASEEPFAMTAMYTDADFVETLRLELSAGRYFSSALATDSSAAVLNEAATRQLGLANPVGRRLRIRQDDQEVEDVTVIGVVNDFHLHSLHQEIPPLVLRMGEWAQWLMPLRIRTDDAPALIASLEATWTAMALPGEPFLYSFLDEDYEALYRAEQTTERVFGVFATLAILIGCLGLFGLAAFTAEQRTKEIGVRKVLGASVTSIVLLLSKKYLALVALAFLVAAPAAYLAMDRWLDTFAYRIDLTWEPFLLTGSLALAIALVTVSYQSIKAALADPVKSLRYE